MKIATFNVNGVNGRLERLLQWLAREQPDIACLQELKTSQTTFPAQALQDAIALVDQLLAAGKINAGKAVSLKSKLNAAIKSLNAGDATSAREPLQSTIDELDGLIRSRSLSASDASALRSLLVRVLKAI